MARQHEDNGLLIVLIGVGGYLAYRSLTGKANAASVTPATAPLATSPSTIPEPVPSAKPKQPGGGVIPVPQTKDANGKLLPRGIRNNNPGNIKASANAWKGKVGKDSGGFEVFDSPQNGLRAMAILLLTYFNKYGLNTINKIGMRWTATNQTGWINTAAKYAQIGKDIPILNMNLTTLMALMQGIVAAENGAAYVDYYDPITRGLAANAALAAG